MLNKQAFDLPALRWLKTAHISLALVGLMWVLPFLYPYHAYPITTFYQEWGAAMLGLSAGLFLIGKQHWVAPVVPRIVLLPIGLMLLVLLQFLLGKIVYFDQAMLFTLYMLWATLLMLLGHALRKQFGVATMATVLAIFLLLGAELSALVGVLQHYRWHTFLDAVVTSKNGIAAYGNLAQPNHYANYIMLGLVSLGLLRSHLRVWQTAILALPLLFVLVLSGSRSSWLYMLAMAVMAFVWQRRDKSCKPLLIYILLLILGFGLMHWIVQLPWFAGTTGSVTTMERMTSGDTSGSVRLYLWHEAWLIFSQFPLLGAGWGQYAWQHFQLSPMLHATNISGLYNNAHNMVMQVAAETGLAGVLVLLSTIGIWVWQNVRANNTGSAYWWGYGVLVVLGIHSMLEYPMWYGYFIGIAAILLGTLDSGEYRLELRGLGRLSVAAIVLLGFMSLVQLQMGYQRLEQALTSRQKSVDDKVSSQSVRDGLVKALAVPLLRPYAELFLSNFIEISSEELDNKLALNERAVKFVPISSVVYRRVALLALDGRKDEAKEQMTRAIWAYPADFPRYREDLSALAQKYPAHFAALLEFAIQKYEEYSSAVSTK